MSTLGREDEAILRNAIKPIVTAIDRLSKASEKMLAIAESEQVTTEIEPGPPVCPFCGATNPVVFNAERSGSGPLAEVAYQFEFQCCHHNVYAVPESWFMTPNRDEALSYIAERRAENVRASD